MVPVDDPGGQTADTAKNPKFHITQLNGSFEAFGVIVDFLSRIQPFSKYDLGNFSKAVRAQLVHGHHLVALSGRTTVGYLGWLPTTEAVAEAWMRGDGRLVPVPEGQADAVVLTVVAATDNETIRPLIRQARRMNADRRVYFKRDGPQGTKKASVHNLGGQ